MKAKSSRLLTRLDESIASATNEFAADCCRAERACYLARQGLGDEAKLVISNLREKYGKSPNFAMSAWLSLGEGLEGYFRCMDSRSHDKVLRAFALSGAAGLSKMQALSAAWLSQMDFARLDIASMAKHAERALELSGPSDNSTRARVSLVIAQALHVARRFDLALPWYRKAHAHATEDGDDSAISALMHNMACMRLDNLRQITLMGLVEDIDAQAIKPGTESTHRFDELIGASSMKAVNPLMKARLHSLEGRPAKALPLYQEHILADPEGMFSRMKSDMLSDVAWCEVQLGHTDRAVSTAAEAEVAIQKDTQTDDRAATHSRLAWVFRATGDEPSAVRHNLVAEREWGIFSQMQAHIIDSLSELSALHGKR